jgi:hypothetical protein
MMNMKRYLPLVIIALVLLGCGKQHPVKVYVAPQYKPADIEKIAVLPFASGLHHSEDPDNVAPQTMDKLFRRELDGRTDYSFMSPASVAYALQGADLTEEAKTFVDDFRQSGQVDQDFIKRCSTAMQADVLLIGVVDLWQKDEVDYREREATPTTYVGATITMLSLHDGSVLFKASDENFIEGVESQASDRGARTSALGSLRSDPGANVYEAPDPELVAAKVVKALVASIPVR